MNTTKFVAASRHTAKGYKVYVHNNCSCARINGKVIFNVNTMDEATAYAADRNQALTVCKTSQPVEAPAAEVVAPAETEAPAVEEATPVAEVVAPAKTKAPAAPAVEEFTVVLNNRDQFGKQRRDAVALLVEAMGAEITATTGIKNKHKTGNDAFAAVVTGAPAGAEAALVRFLGGLVTSVAKVIEDAKAEGAAAGWDANTRQKHYKNQARAFIVAEGAKAAAAL